MPEERQRTVRNKIFQHGRRKIVVQLYGKRYEVDKHLPSLLNKAYFFHCETRIEDAKY